MSDPHAPQRRRFVKLCATAAAAVGANPKLLAAGQEGPAHRYARVRLTGDGGRPLRASSLVEGESYVFDYPYVTTPCFLLDLGVEALPDGPLETADGARYEWPGGVGPRRSIVAFAAICAHKMTHPSRTVSFINYRHEPVSFRGEDDRTVKRSGVIYCCSEKSVYDPARGARVLGGPAPQPLAAILLEHDPGEDALYAAGTFGGEMYRKFFASFSFRLALERGTAEVERMVEGTARVMPIGEYSSTTILC